MTRIPRCAGASGKTGTGSALATHGGHSVKVAAEDDLPPDLRSENRERAVAWPRQDAMRLMIGAGYSTTQIGRFSSVTIPTVISGAGRRARMEGAQRWLNSPPSLSPTHGWQIRPT